MAMAVGGGGGVQSNINMTPMIDILLVLMIIFMVITPVHPKGLEALVPQPPPPNQPPPPDNERTVVIIIDKQHNVKINQEDIDLGRAAGPSDRDLQDPRRARGLRQGRSRSGISWVAQAIDIAHGADIDKVGLMTPKVEAGQ